MMKNKKMGLRLVTFLSILMLLLMPMLSSPVTAAFTTTSSVNTNCVGMGWPIVTVTIPPPPYNNPDVAPRTATFVCNYNFNDAGPPSAGSKHRATMTIIRTPGPNPAGSPVSTGWITLSGSSTGGTLTLMDTWTIGSSVSWQITIVGDCQDIGLGRTTSVSRTYTVTVP